MQSSAIAALASVAVAAAASAQSFTTVFGPGGTVGAATPDAAVLNGIESVAQFGVDNLDIGLLGGTLNIGQTLFFQVGPLYVGGSGPASSNPLSAEGLLNLGGPVAGNRAYGVIGAGRSDIAFAPGLVDEVVLQIRGTADGQTTGTNPATNFGGVPTDLADAAGTLLVYTEAGLQATLAVTNDDFQLFSLDAADFIGDSITRVSLVNEGPDNSAVVLGELTVTLIPAPAGAAALGLAGLAAARRRR